MPVGGIWGIWNHHRRTLPHAGWGRNLQLMLLWAGCWMALHMDTILPGSSLVVYTSVRARRLDRQPDIRCEQIARLSIPTYTLTHTHSRCGCSIGIIYTQRAYSPIYDAYNIYRIWCGMQIVDPFYETEFGVNLAAQGSTHKHAMCEYDLKIKIGVPKRIRNWEARD